MYKLEEARLAHQDQAWWEDADMFKFLKRKPKKEENKEEQATTKKRGCC